MNSAWEIVQEYFGMQSAGATPQESPQPQRHAGAADQPPREKASRKTLVIVCAAAALVAIALVILVKFDLNPFKPSGPADLSDVIRKVKPSIVTIVLNDVARGSGFVVSDDGYIVTNAHVMRDRSGKAAFADGTSVDVDLVFIDPDRDFALLQAKTPRKYPYLKLGDSGRCSEGDTVIAAGSPLSFQTTFTRGIISSVRRTFPAYSASFIQTDAALSPGNSGGPLINLKGDVVGINSLKISGMAVEGMGFAVSINDVKGHIATRQHMADADISTQLARAEKKIEEMNQWRDPSSQKMKDRSVEAQWEYERKRREYNERVAEAHKQLQEERDRQQQMIREQGEQRRSQVREHYESQQKALSDCLQTARSYYESGWNDGCRSLNMTANCKLPYSHANILEQRHMQARKECFSLYQR